MTKEQRAELIAALVTDKFSGFENGDMALLEAAGDERLEKFRAATDAGRAAFSAHERLETELRNTAARLRVAEAAIKDGEKEMTKEEFLQRAPQEFKDTLEAAKAIEDATKAGLVSALEDRGVLKKEELEQKSIGELQTLAQFARVDVPDFSGKGVPKQRNASDKVSYAPPNPYEAGIKDLQSRSKAVN